MGAKENCLNRRDYCDAVVIAVRRGKQVDYHLRVRRSCNLHVDNSIKIFSIKFYDENEDAAPNDGDESIPLISRTNDGNTETANAETISAGIRVYSGKSEFSATGVKGKYERGSCSGYSTQGGNARV